jgi:hypothetical protein
MLRPKEAQERAQQCLHAARELAGRARDMEAVRQASAALHSTRQGQRLLALALVAAGQMAEAHALMEQLLAGHATERQA